MTENHNWLAEYARTGADAAFRELVGRYVDLVYSTALRLVEGDAHRAQDVTQKVFINLARTARTLPADVKLGGWLHRDTCFAAATLMRGERRRAVRERQAAEMNAMSNDAGNMDRAVAAELDEAINELDEPDRLAILHRFFEQQDFRAVGRALGTSEDAARMRVTRALEKLEAGLKRRGVATTAASLGVILAASAVQSAPAGLALVVAGAALAGTTAVTSSIVIKSIAMTTLQKTVLVAVVAAAVGSGIYEVHQAWRLRDENEALRQQQGPLNEQMAQLQNERDEALKQLAVLSKPVPHLPAPPVVLAAAPADALQATNLYERFKDLKDKQVKLTREQAEAYLKANGRTATSLLAAFRTSGDEELLREAMQKFPNDPHVAFEAAMSPRLTPEEQQQWLAAFVKSAPNNGLANYLQAASDFKAGQVDEGLQELAAAAGKSFDDYTSVRAQNDVEAFLAAGYPIADAKTLGISELTLPHLAELKQLTLNLVDLAKAYQQAGDQSSAQSALQMAVNLGQNYVTPSPGEPLINQLVGIAIERGALGAMDPNSPYGSNGQTVQDALNQLVQQREAIGQLARQFDALRPKLSDQDWVNYRDRWLGFGEMAAEQWVIGKYGGDAGK